MYTNIYFYTCPNVNTKLLLHFSQQEVSVFNSPNISSLTMTSLQTGRLSHLWFLLWTCRMKFIAGVKKINKTSWCLTKNWWMQKDTGAAGCLDWFKTGNLDLWHVDCTSKHKRMFLFYFVFLLMHIKSAWKTIFLSAKKTTFYLFSFF